MKIYFSLFLLFSAVVSASAQSKQTANTLKLDEGSAGAAATITDLKWLAGTWSGTGLGGSIEEIWSEPQNGVMMGMFRLFSEGKLSFYEFMVLEERNGSLVMRLKHFAPDLVGWEEKDKTVDFPFIKKDSKRYYFNGLTFEPRGDVMDLFLAMRSGDGSFREAKFVYKRMRSGK
ncbi:MAG: hypothetical protein IPM50_04620 [Acidobacteriota bacterium]|nr:MAG: hypothetical protein IPM50_04620 [Acidobacteriota bacterium]